MVLMDYLLCWFVVVRGGFHGGVDTGFLWWCLWWFLVVMLMVAGVSFYW